MASVGVASTKCRECTRACITSDCEAEKGAKGEEMRCAAGEENYPLCPNARKSARAVKSPLVEDEEKRRENKTRIEQRSTKINELNNQENYTPPKKKKIEPRYMPKYYIKLIILINKLYYYNKKGNEIKSEEKIRSRERRTTIINSRRNKL